MTNSIPGPITPEEVKTAERWLVVILSLVLMVPSILFDGWVLMVLWNWFIPAATGWEPIGFWLACGLRFFKTYILAKYSPADASAGNERGRLATYIESYTFNVVVGLVTLGFGWFIHNLMV